MVVDKQAMMKAALKCALWPILTPLSGKLN
jgi:hypothetical protein